MIERACRLEVEVGTEEKRQQKAYKAFQEVLEKDPEGPRRLKGVLEVMMFEGRHTDTVETFDRGLVNDVLNATSKDDVVFGATEAGHARMFGDSGHRLVRTRMMRLETAVIRRRLAEEPKIEGVRERLEKLAEIRALMGLRALVGDYIEDEMNARIGGKTDEEADLLNRLQEMLDAEHIDRSELATAA